MFLRGKLERVHDGMQPVEVVDSCTRSKVTIWTERRQSRRVGREAAVGSFK